MRSTLMILFIFLVFVFTSCGQTSTSETQTKESAKDSPIGVLKTFTDAKADKDGAAMKQTISKNTLDTIAGVAKAKGLSIEEYLSKGNTTPLNNPAMPETRNERIEGEKAFVEIKRSSADAWRKLTFVKEDNVWKMDLAAYMDELYPNLKKENQ